MKMNFENWYNKILVESETAVKTEVAIADQSVPVVASREDMMSDVDSIMTKLDQLSAQVKEDFELNLLEESYLNEVTAGEMGSSIWQYIWTGPRAKKMQSKINQIKLAKADVQFAADNAKNDAQKKLLNNKVKALDSQIDTLQSSLQDRYGSSGEIVNRMIRSEKLKGDLEVSKKILGMDPSDSEKASIQSRMKSLQSNYQEELNAIKELEPSDEEKKEAIEKIRKQKEEEANRRKEDAETRDGANSKEPATEPKGEGEPEPKGGSNAEKDALIQQDKDKEPATEPKGEGEPEPKGEGEPEPKATKNTKDDKLARIEALIKKEEDKISKNPELDTEKLDKLKKLRDQISAKENWQLEGTELGKLYEMEISKLEATYTINESKHLSVADKFRMLLR